jgi:NAD(P)-dependent dehydrogenase (short-subunit alcohol dehydrogenase family)
MLRDVLATRLGYGSAMALDLSGKTFLVTGANTGIGKSTAEHLSDRGAHVVLACRSLEKTQPLMEALRGKSPTGSVEFLPLDLSSLRSVAEAARRFVDSARPLHGLINNAALAGHGGLTEDGFEMAFGVNHLGHFLLTLLLKPALERALPVRIVNVSSGSHFQAKGIDFAAVRAPKKSVTGLPEYEVSKLANVLFTRELGPRWGNAFHTYSLHPGVVASDLWRRVPPPFRQLMKMFMIRPADGARTTLYCATSAEAGRETGLYYEKERPVASSRVSEDALLGKALWNHSLEWVRPFLTR